ncbi:MAG TPA: ABC transporter substrate binding protein [Thermoanaerobaculia bacterium]|jgi:putative ABC transport system substrate-binding protein
MRRIGVVNAYTLPKTPGRQTLRMRAFVDALAANGWREGREVAIDLVDAESDAEARSAARRFADERVDLIHSFGTPVTVAVAETTSEIPIVYYGAHPEGIGDAACSAPNVTGQVIRIPFTSSYKSFRFLRRMVPRARVVWVAFYEGTMFVPPAMRAAHRAARERAGRRVWIPGSSEEVGFRTHAALAYIVGVEYRELVYSDTAELAAALEEIDPADGVLMLYNEPFYSSGATDLFLEVCRRRDIPLIWNNNPQVAALGGLCGIGADFVELGRVSGELAAAVLAGARPSDLPRRVHDRRMAWINLDTAERLGLHLESDVLNYFDRHIRGCPGDPCM